MRQYFKAKLYTRILSKHLPRFADFHLTVLIFVKVVRFIYLFSKSDKASRGLWHATTTTYVK